MGNRSLAINLSGGNDINNQNCRDSDQSISAMEDDSDDVSDYIDEIIDCLLQGLKDKDTVVRCVKEHIWTPVSLSELTPY